MSSQVDPGSGIGKQQQDAAGTHDGIQDHRDGGGDDDRQGCR
nr:hypothetical protein [Halomonas chromatireducens]